MILIWVSHPAWVCGLKLDHLLSFNLHFSHTLRGCVDWNGLVYPYCSGKYRHTLRGCVDWNSYQYKPLAMFACHTLRGCVDWNITIGGVKVLNPVTPCVGVWIETSVKVIIPFVWIVTPCVGVWIETSCVDWIVKVNGHTLRGCVDWNRRPCPPCRWCNGHTLRGCVDWNMKDMADYMQAVRSHPAWVCGLKRAHPSVSRGRAGVTPCVGVWIETFVPPITCIMLSSHPAWVCGLKL